MILRNAAVRHGRRALAVPVPRSTLRCLSSEAVTTETAVATPPPNAELPIDSANASYSSALRRQEKMQRVEKTTMTLGTDSTPIHQTPAWTTPHRNGSSNEVLTPKEQWDKFREIRKNTNKLGSVVKHEYRPTDLVNNPPAAKDVTLELLMASQTHMGHHTSLWNPANSRYIHGVRDGIHIISLETTAAHLRRAARVVEEVARLGGLIVFVGTRKGQMEIVTRAAELAGACHVFTKWTAGAITNRDNVLGSASTKVVDEHDRPLDDFDMYKNDSRPLLPDLVVCLNSKENYPLLRECALKDIPSIGIIDTDVDPTWATYAIPANDDSLRSVAVIAGVLARAGERGQQLRKEASQKPATVPWNTSGDLQGYMASYRAKVKKEQKEAIAMGLQNVEEFNEEEQRILQSQYVTPDLDTSETAMLGFLGQAGTREEAAKVPAAAAAAAASASNLGEVEAQLASLTASMSEVEGELQKMKN